MKKRNEFKHTISFIEEELSAGSFPGAALAVMLGDLLLVERYWGSYSSRTRRDIPVDASTVHMLYSFSKGITSTVFAMFLADDVVDLDAPVWRYIPEYRNGLWDQTLVRHLLTHAAGIPSAQLTAAHHRGVVEQGGSYMLRSGRRMGTRMPHPIPRQQRSPTGRRSDPQDQQYGAVGRHLSTSTL